MTPVACPPNSAALKSALTTRTMRGGGGGAGSSFEHAARPVTTKAIVSEIQRRWNPTRVPTSPPSSPDCVVSHHDTVSTLWQGRVFHRGLPFWSFRLPGPEGIGGILGRMENHLRADPGREPGTFDQPPRPRMQAGDRELDAVRGKSCPGIFQSIDG